MCRGPRGLAVSMAFMIVGFVAVVFGSFLPFWSKGRGLDVGLFYQCEDWNCGGIDSFKSILYVIDVVILLGIVVMAFGMVFVVHLCVERCKGGRISSRILSYLPLFLFFAPLLDLIGAIVYCVSVYSDNDDHSLNFCPWLVISGATVTATSCVFLPRTLKDVLVQVSPKGEKKRSKKKEMTLESEQGSHYDRQKYFENQRVRKQQEDLQSQEQYLESGELQQQYQQQKQQQQQQRQQNEEEEEEEELSQDQQHVHSLSFNSSDQSTRRLAFPEPRSYPYHTSDPDYPPPPYRIHI